jgi:hypothetical protein
MQWGWPVFFNAKDGQNMEDSLKKYRNEIRRNVDKELERGWIWAVGSTFYARDHNYDYRHELGELDNELNKGVQKLQKQSVDTGQKGDKKWINGRIVAHYRRTDQTKFFLHNDIPEETRRIAVKAILVMWFFFSPSLGTHPIARSFKRTSR